MRALLRLTNIKRVTIGLEVYFRYGEMYKVRKITSDMVHLTILTGNHTGLSSNNTLKGFLEDNSLERDGPSLAELGYGYQ